MTSPGLNEVFISILLILLSLAIVRYWKIPVAKDISIGSIRSFIQLVAVGYALEYIFGLESFWLVALALIIMTVVGAFTAAGRIKEIKGGFLITLIAMSVGSSITLISMLLLDIISLEARYIIPLGGMIIGNSMNASALTADRLRSDITRSRLAIETSLSLGKSWRASSIKLQRDAATTGMISILNSMKTLGIVALPGAMTGMILGGASPLEAVYLQIIVMYMILTAVVVTSVVTISLTVRTFFTINHQLRSNP